MIRLGMKIAVIAIFVLNGAALVFGILLFQQRETLKGRTQKLETTIKQIAATIEAGDATDVKMVIPDDQLKTYKQQPGGPAPMEIPLKQLTVAAQDQLTRLNGTRSVLAETKTTLAKTEDELKTTQNDLASAKGEIVKLNETVASKNAVIEEKDVSIKTLEREKGELTTKTAALTTQVEELETQTRDLTDQVAELQDKVKTLGFAKGSGGKIQLPKGQQGTVLYVNPDWNFLIIGIASESQKNMVPELELLIQRADRLVGKVRVEAIVNNMAIAEIMNDWQQIIPQKGDYVIY
ncbi:MAG: hypothetical protein KKE37_01970 [Verrucomicrobia bacterium]|nr:hypothetical protein [Verrucomicrobiota bacterium]MBU4291693.1 hypothetical protein [Verrucomicrobiota bacterium]MBU4428103.1 hypothetical protein [Verrucomicrobiota bacterium]MCG2680422.1 hypothetical protein [Kiritimatiellia bacterium]